MLGTNVLVNVFLDDISWQLQTNVLNNHGSILGNSATMSILEESNVHSTPSLNALFVSSKS